MKLSTNSTKSLNKCEVTFMSQHKRLKAKQSKNEGKNVSISELLTQQGTNLRQLNANRKGTTISLVRPGQSVQVFNCFAHQKSLEPLAASSMTITCAKIWRRWGRIILWNTSPHYAQTNLITSKSDSYIIILFILEARAVRSNQNWIVFGYQIECFWSNWIESNADQIESNRMQIKLNQIECRSNRMNFSIFDTIRFDSIWVGFWREKNEKN